MSYCALFEAVIRHQLVKNWTNSRQGTNRWQATGFQSFPRRSHYSSFVHVMSSFRKWTVATEHRSGPLFSGQTSLKIKPLFVSGFWFSLDPSLQQNIFLKEMWLFSDDAEPRLDMCVQLSLLCPLNALTSCLTFQDFTCFFSWFIVAKIRLKSN